MMHTLQTKTKEKKSANVGNRFFAPLQAKLTVNQPNDVYEQEADAVADKVMRTMDHSTKSPLFFPPVGAPLQRKEQNSSEAAAPDQLTDYVGV
ncbi:hypothetical protein [Niabella hibiscisoli]|uniref:hypothetical protein n=1 Tax=Niabella hibiscisoli TaxID=1825928 RepID=UPI001F0E13F0|nr:hypothetical protein [Niabella hibiscisoli]MCH5716210.1 hypothetical protein [Niabella hibiscisoli]